MSNVPPLVSAAVEGGVDEAVVRRLLAEVGAQPGAIHVVGGKPHLKDKIRAYNHAAAQHPWVVLVDLNHEESCAPALRNRWLPHPARLMCFRVAVREVESWLLADRQSISQFLRVALARVPRNPDSLDDPKRTIVDLARRSRRREIREDMVPRPDSGRSEGPAYASRLIEYSLTLWRPSVAVGHSDSLRRCSDALRTLAARCQGF
ncbi:MAG: DUF4276 family protein [Thermoguttaceae bacterium]|jgi:hypothetical protein|nr:DUF4276 family protein [Thermoguttaceae bacterium]